MKNLIKNVRTQENGFTLVELLVVIVIIGILATGVLAAINPIEQIRRGRDTARQSAAREYMAAAERYYGMNDGYPWDQDGYGGVDPSSGAQELGTNWSDIGEPLVDAQELKGGFENRGVITDDDLTAFEDDNAQIHVCFQPESDAFVNRADCSTNEPAGDGSVCDGTAAGDGSEYFCVPDSN